MAEVKKDSLLSDMLADVHKAAGVVPPKDWQKAAEDAEARLKVMEDFMAGLLPDLHYGRTALFAISQSAPKRFDLYYKQCRTLLGARGDAIDAGLRGQ